MKNVKILLLIIIASISILLACSKAQQSPDDPQAQSPADSLGSLEGKRVLIVYLSRTNNTKAIANIIHQNVGGELVEIEVQNPYPEHYQTTVDQVARENQTGFLPPLKTKIDSIEKYDVVFVGFPTWGMQLPPPIKSFLSQYKLDGKVVIPFNTNAGYGIGSTFQTVEALCPNSDVLEGFSTQGGIERDGVYFVIEGEKEKQAQTEIKQWLQKIGLIKAN
jgi:flavodoxin